VAELSRHGLYLVTSRIERQKWRFCDACDLFGPLAVRLVVAADRRRSGLPLELGNLGPMTSPYEDDEPLLPDQTRDDDPRSWGENDSGSDDDERILREVPPHH
jgi:hypothetical protein